MRRIIFVLLLVTVVFAFSGCDIAWNLSEEDAKKVLEVVSSAASGSTGLDTGRSVEENARALTASFNKEQANGGTALFTARTERNTNTTENLSNALAYFDVLFTDFEVSITDEDDVTTDYILNGMMYMEYRYILNWSAGFTFGQEVLCFTDPEADDVLSINGGGINTALELQVTNNISMNLSDNGYSMNYAYTGSCNGQVFNDESGTLTVDIE